MATKNLMLNVFRFNIKGSDRTYQIKLGYTIFRAEIESLEITIKKCKWQASRKLKKHLEMSWEITTEYETMLDNSSNST